jgi:hypothetical protein
VLPLGGSPEMHRLGLWVELDWALYHPRSTEKFPRCAVTPTCLWSGGLFNFEI